MCLREPKVLEPKRGEIWDGTIQTDLLGEIESAETKLRWMKEGRHRPFFDYAILLARARLGRDEIELKLEEIAGLEAKMRKKIPGIMRSLYNYGWFED